ILQNSLTHIVDLFLCFCRIFFHALALIDLDKIRSEFFPNSGNMLWSKTKAGQVSCSALNYVIQT
ncbi:MAG: hypothetical protein II634_01645, partial [Lachnospiraceae bacterium]|nr:hypothetical protein [Lachnospiraceae bacterium]